jgi:hypothetical protein
VTIPRQLLSYTLTVMLTMLVWFAFRGGEDALAAPCATSCHSFGAYEAHDPFCIVDPTCVSPFYRQATEATHYWQGPLALNSALMYGKGFRELALPNYAAFLVLGMSLAGWSQSLLRRHRTLRTLAIVSICSWSVFEIAGWSAVISSIDPMTRGSTLRAEHCC